MKHILLASAFATGCLALSSGAVEAQTVFNGGGGVGGAGIGIGPAGGAGAVGGGTVGGGGAIGGGAIGTGGAVGRGSSLSSGFGPAPRGGTSAAPNAGQFDRPGGVADGGGNRNQGWNRPGRQGGWQGRGGRGRHYPAYGYGYGYGGGFSYGGGYGYPYGYDDDGYAAASYEEEVAPVGDAQAAECARRFKTYDPRTGTYIAKGGKRSTCP